MATGFDNAQQLIEQKFNTAWNAATPIAFDNVEFDPPATVDQWVRLNVLDEAAFVAGMGGGVNLYRHPGIVIVQVFIRDGSGIREAKQLADTVAAIFRGANENGILYRAPYVETVGPNNGWFQVNVNIPFHWDAQF